MIQAAAEAVAVQDVSGANVVDITCQIQTEIRPGNTELK